MWSTVIPAVANLLTTDAFVSLVQRFEHSTGYHKKIGTYVSFPDELDMTPFMSSSRNHNNGYSEQVIQEAASSLSSENKYVLLITVDWCHILLALMWHY